MRGPFLFALSGRRHLIRVSAPPMVALNWAFSLKFKWRANLAGRAGPAAALSL
jgi:hypothetical protein